MAAATRNRIFYPSCPLKVILEDRTNVKKVELTSHLMIKIIYNYDVIVQLGISKTANCY